MAGLLEGKAALITGGLAMAHALLELERRR